MSGVRRRAGAAAVIFGLSVAAAGSLPPHDARDLDGDRARAEALLEEGAALAQYGAFTPAQEKGHEALAMAERLSDDRITAKALSLLGRAADGQGDFAAGSPLHARALAIARRIGDQRMEAAFLADVGLGRWRQADYAGAMENLQGALTLQERLGDRRGMAWTFVLIGRVHFKQGRYQEAEQHHRRALAIQEALGDLAGQGITLEDLGDVALETDRFRDAIDRFESSLALRERVRDARGQVWILTVIGTAYLRQGAPLLAAERFRRALALAGEAEDPAGRAAALYHLGIAGSHQGRFHEASGSFGEAMRIHEKLGDRRALAWDLSYMASARRALGDASGAVDGYRRAIAIRREIGDLRALATDLSHLADVYEITEGHRKALATYEEALALEEQIDLPFRSQTLGRIGLIHARTGDASRALDSGRRSLEAADATGNPELRWGALHGLGMILRRVGRPREALGRLQESLAIVESLKPGVVPLDETRRGFMDGKQSVYVETASLLLEMGRAREALETTERGRSRAFLDLLESRARRDGNEPPGQEITWRGAEAGSSRAPEPARAASPPDLSRIAGQLAGRGSILVEYMMAEDRIGIWVMRPDGSIRATTVPVRSRDLETLIGRMRQALASSPSSGPDPILDETLRRLHAILIEPVERDLPADPDDVVMIVPHGPLFLVSFAALRAPDGRYLAERHAVSYLPAASLLESARAGAARASGEPHLLLVGNPAAPPLPGHDSPLPDLPGAAEEVEAIRRLYAPDQVEVLRGSKAQEQVVTKRARGPAIIHLATHAVIRDDDPMNSLVVLAAGGGDQASSDRDGLWTAWEVLHAGIQADLVVLSACDTGLGNITGEGVIGLSRAFLSAGARSVLASLWRVADVAGRFQMERFHRALKQGAGKAAALRRAQAETIAALRERRLATPAGRLLEDSPAYWAPFILVGEARGTVLFSSP